MPTELKSKREAAEMEEERLFASNPISYRMERRSPGAFALRDAVRRKLFDFMRNYTDEVLAEYIVVLVCNGKHQKQAREDLKAFLGDDSGKFVAWLWDHLAKESYTAGVLLDNSDGKPELLSNHEGVSSEEPKPNSSADLHSHSSGMSGIRLPKDGIHDLSNRSAHFNCSKVIQAPENLQSQCSGQNGSLSEKDNGKLQAHLSEIGTEQVQAESKLMSKDSYKAYHMGTMKRFSSIVRCFPEIQSGDKQLYDEYQQQKIPRIDSGAQLRHLKSAPRVEESAQGLRSIITGDYQSTPRDMTNSTKIRRVSPPIDSAVHQIDRPRGNVWDRLGKPLNEDDAEMRGRKNQHDDCASKRVRELTSTSTDYQGEELQTPRSMWIKQSAPLKNNQVAESVQLEVVPDSHSEIFRKLDYSSHLTTDIPRANISKGKKLSSELILGDSSVSLSRSREDQLQANDVHQKMHDGLPVKIYKPESFRRAASDVKRSPVSVSDSAFISGKVEHNSQADATIVQSSQPDKDSSHQSALMTSKTQKEVGKKNQSPFKSEASKKAECHGGAPRPVKDEVLDVKSKLQRIESEVMNVKSKLHLRQGESRNDAKTIKSTGVHDSSEADVDSRTVLVTNVHYAASREALISHFTRCGPVAKALMLMDTITAQPKGAAYIVFANKDSVEKAVAMSGTSFFSRILTVVRKADMPSDFLVPSSPGWKLTQPLNSPPFWKAYNHRASPHLQWRRENSVLAERENTASVVTKELKSSTTAE